jgi:hypothetical protein
MKKPILKIVEGFRGEETVSFSIDQQTFHLEVPNIDNEPGRAEWYRKQLDTAFTRLLRTNVEPLKAKQIKKLRPTFSLDGGMSVVEWFEVHHGKYWCTIRSGLNHADGVTVSPYNVTFSTSGDGAKKAAVLAFNNWWFSLEENQPVDVTTPAREEFIVKVTELANEYWTMNLRDGSYLENFKELLNQYYPESN